MWAFIARAIVVNRSESEWELRFRTWAGGPGDTELQRCENTAGMIRKAIARSEELKPDDIEVFAQGSFRNLTNIAQDSDVDICVCLRNQFYYEVPKGADPGVFDITPNDREFYPYKDAVHRALQDYFGDDQVTRGNKAIRVHSNTYRVDADVVAAWEFREYFDESDTDNVRKGVEFRADDGSWVKNFPKQHIEEGIAKNDRTRKRFKRLARVLKSLQMEMLDEGVIEDALPSFLIESLVYNVPDDHFDHERYIANVRAVLAYLFNNTRPADDASGWFEVNHVKYLFHVSQPWTKAQAHAFVSAAWDYIGFEG